MKVKVLQVTSGFRKGVSGGIASVLYNYGTSDAFDRCFQMDYLALGYQPFEPYKEMFMKRGSKVMSLGIHVGGINRLLEIYIELRSFLKKNKYDIVHINSGAPAQVLASVLAAKSAGIPVVIAHSHNALILNFKRTIAYPIVKYMIGKKADYYFACSEMAARSMFSRKIINAGKWIYLPNAIDVEKFAYSVSERRKIRQEFQLENMYVVGHVGRFNEQKNHEFLIELFAELCKLEDDVRLLLLGTGDLEEYIKSKVESLKLTNKVIFAGQRKDVNKYLSAMDIFIMPSKWEGLPVTVVEAQANGLHCIISNKITKEVNITDSVDYLSIENVKCWVDKLLEMKRCLYKREDKVSGTSFDVRVSGEKLAAYYTEFLNRQK